MAGMQGEVGVQCNVEEGNAGGAALFVNRVGDTMAVCSILCDTSTWPLNPSHDAMDRVMFHAVCYGVWHQGRQDQGPAVATMYVATSRPWTGTDATSSAT